MAPLELEGDTLGKRHKHYNHLVKQAVEQNQSSILLNINYEENDIENLLKIDVASKSKNVVFILKVLKCEDMLYVSRAIKQCPWLISDVEYVDIINPQYLYTQLFPEMTTKARNKLLLQIRLHLKDEKRVDNFYEYYEERDINIAIKWLPNCSLPVIEKAVQSHANEIKSNSIIKRLCRKSITILDLFLRDYYCYKGDIMKSVIFLLKTHTEKYLEIVEKCHSHEFPKLGPKSVQIIMTKCPHKIIDNFEKYSRNIDLATFAKYMKKDDIKSFILKQAKNEKIRTWLSFDKIKHFIKFMPKDGRFEFLKDVFIDKINKESDSSQQFMSDICARKQGYFCAAACTTPNTSANIYRWYQFAPFQVAFPDLKKLIRSESSPEERCAILTVLLTCAGRNMQNIQSLLQFYHDKHINEPFKFKNQFINKVITQTNTHRYDDKTWNILNEIFHCMEVYIESTNNVQSCIQTIIVYKVTHNENIPEIIEKKFEFNSLKKIQTKISDTEKDQIFNYLHKILRTKLENISITNQIQVDETIKLLKDAVTLLADWKKDILKFTWILDKIRELIEIKRTKSLIMDLASLYNMNKSWRKHLFEESLIMNPKEETYLNALKHRPEMLLQHRDELNSLTCDDSLTLKQFLNKLRIYWFSSLATELTTLYQNRLNQLKGHRALVSGLCMLLPQQQLLEITKKYAPSDSKINWSGADELLLSLQKHIARNMYLARPQPPPDTILLYAKGNYLQFVLPSLNSVFYNLSSVESQKLIPKLMESPVSLQKHGIRLAFEKLKTDEVKQIFTEIWKSNKNSSIRTVLFKHTFDLLCREKQSTVIIELWEVLSMFINNLSMDENRIVYNTLAKVKDVPKTIQGDFCKKSYLYLNSLPPKANCKNIVQKVVSYMPEIVGILDPNFVEEISLEFIENTFIKEKNEYKYDDLIHLISAYQLCAKDEESSIQRYQKVLVPLINHSFRLWETLLEEDYYMRRNLYSVLNYLCRDVMEYGYKNKMHFPVKVFADMQDKFEKALSLPENYKLLRYWKLTVAFVRALENHKVQEIKFDDDSSTQDAKAPWCIDNENWNKVFLVIAPEFAKICKEYLKEDINTYSSSIYILFAKAIDKTFDSFNISDACKLEISKNMLNDEGAVEIYLFVLKLLPRYGLSDKDDEKMKELRKMLLSHPSLEVKMQYYERFDKPKKGVEIP